MSDNTSFNKNSITQLTRRASRQVLWSCKSFAKQLIARKPMKDIQIEIETKNEMRRTLNWIQLTGIGLGSIIGAGIFVTSGQAAKEYAGPSVIISFFIAGIVALLAALSFSEMAVMMASSGSAYTYTYAALGEYCAWIVACNLILIYQLAASTIVVSWSTRVVHFVGLVSNLNISNVFIQAPLVAHKDTIDITVTGDVLNLPAIGITIAITILLFIGIRQTAIINLFFDIIKILALLIFIFACCKYVNTSNYYPFIPPNKGSFNQFGITGMLKGSTSVFFAYVGFESVATAAQEADKPSRTLPISLIGSLVISMLIYLGVSTVMVGLIPYNLIDEDNPLTDVIKATPYGLWLLIIMDLGAIAGVTTVALTILLPQTCIFYAMAHDGLLPPIFARIHSRTKTPWISILISGAVCAVTAGICSVDILGETTSVAALITYFFVHVSVIVMRYTHSDMPRTFQVPLSKWLIPTVGALLCLLLLTHTSTPVGIRVAIFMGIGHIINFSYGFLHSKRRLRIRQESMTNLTADLPTVENTYMNHAYTNFETNSIDETTA
ncbi:unnamed protein product [Adineta steineri]|uniref:Uncharacterized protein n=1 Tax=Adineta steineri TaxID=433720 RepID=A0A814RP26_9BILA|nr:unnamed protein product [Adineta steineri]CAF1136859.1 unnamed protein product [Adineta steineri]CAF1140080.1 unnamed protein product [Adineta steineri]